MKPVLRKDPHPDADFYYDQQFNIYHEPYLIWDRDTWEAVLSACAVYRIEVDGKDAGDVILEDRGRGKAYIVDFSVLPPYQGRGVGKAILGEVEKIYRRITAVTREETLPFFLKSGFTLKRTIRDYYGPGRDGYYLVKDGKREKKKEER